MFADFARACARLASLAQDDPISNVAWLPLQYSFLSSDAKVKQIRAGNQTIGKSWAALAEVIGHCRGKHPLGRPVRRLPPIEAWVICASWSQSLGIQKKLWQLLPKSELSPRTRFDPVSGFAPTKQPVVEFLNGSIIRIKTTGQDALDFAGATIHVVLFDEPPRSPRMYTEALQRLEEMGGVLLLSYTPINAPVEYLRKLAESGQIEDHWARLTPEQLIPVGWDRPLRTKDGRPKDAAYIAEREAKVPEHERGVVVHGEWETRIEGAYFSPVFRRGTHVADLGLVGRWSVHLGIDHGHQPGKQCAVLVCVREMGTYRQVHILDEYTDPTGRARPEDDASAILAMLRRNGLSWQHLDSAHGDRVHMPGSSSEKSNQLLSREIARQLGILGSDEIRPPIETVKRGDGRGAGSVALGERWLYNQLATPGAVTIHPRCVRGIVAFERYVGTDDDQGSKDWMDALRYALDRMIFAPEFERGRQADVRFR